MQAVGRIPDQAGLAADERDAAVDLLLLPEPRRVEADLVGEIVGRRGDRRLHVLGEVVVDLGQQRQRQGDDRVVALDRLGLAADGVAIGDLHALAVGPDLGDLGVPDHRAADGALEAGDDLVHAADRLEHRRLHVDVVFEQGGADLRVADQVAERRRIARLRELVRRAGRLQQARTLGALERHVLAEVAIGLQERQQLFLVLEAQVLVEGALVHRLGQQLGDVAAGVVDPLAHLQLLAAVGPEVGAAAGVDLDLQRHAQLAAIGQQPLVMAGNARRPRVHVEPVGEAHGLRLLADHLDLVAVAQRPVAPAQAPARLQQRHVIAGPLQLIGRHQAGDAAAQNDHPLAAARVRGHRRRRRRRHRAHQTQGPHRRIGRAVAAGRAKAVKKQTPTDPHLSSSPINHQGGHDRPARLSVQARGRSSAGSLDGVIKRGAPPA